MNRRPRSNSSGVGWFEVALIASGLGVLYWYHKHHANEGVDLWSALGFAYGPIGNLPAIGGDYRTGINAMPVLMSAAQLIPNTLTDIGGTALTDLSNNVLTDIKGGAIPPQLFQSRNAAGIKLTLNFKGSKPS